MKTIFSGYYGGKTNMLKHIMPLFPPHETYIEPFFGGGAVFWAKFFKYLRMKQYIESPEAVEFIKSSIYVPSRYTNKYLNDNSQSLKEIINDADGRIMNFWEVLSDDAMREMLIEKVDKTLYAEKNYRDTSEILKNIDAYNLKDESLLPEIQWSVDGNYSRNDKVLVAWALFVNFTHSFGGQFLNGFAFSRSGKQNKDVKQNGIHSFPLQFYRNKGFLFLNKDLFKERLSKVVIMQTDALNVIKRTDAPHAFTYLDPPYPNSNCGHYESRKGVFWELLPILPNLKGKFLLSSYKTDELTELVNENGWTQLEFKKGLLVSGKAIKADRTKIECLTFNYPIPNKGKEIFTKGERPSLF